MISYPRSHSVRRHGVFANRSRRVSRVNLLCRVLSVDAIACPRCSTRERRVPMTVLAFLTDPDVVGKILRHAPGHSPSRAGTSGAGRDRSSARL